MTVIGRINKLLVKSIQEDGAILDGGESGDIFLPPKYIPEQCSPGDRLEVFVYADKLNNLRATTQKPYAAVGEFARLRVITNSQSGSYLDWGLKKNLLVPKSEQITKMAEGKFYIVFIFLDEKTNRITASTKLHQFTSITTPVYEEGEEVDLFIYEKTNLGYKAFINNSHEGIIYKNEVFQNITVGQKLKGYIKKIRLDLKIDLTLQKSGYSIVDNISQNILTKIKEFGGSIAITDKSPPEDIYSVFGVSKKVFKKAIGALYKKRLIKIDANKISLTKGVSP